MEKVVVSIVIPTYNRQDLLLKAIDSLFNQTYRQFEIIVVDDCSTDGTQEALNRLNDPRVIYMRHTQNKGAGEARNTGIEKAQGEYVAFLDSDDKWLPTKLEKQVHIFEQNDAIGAVYTGVKKADEGSVISITQPKYRGDILAELMKKNSIDTTSSVMIKTKWLREIGGFDSSLPSCQDWDLYIRLAQVTQFDFVKEPLVIFCQHEGERITTNNRSVVEGHLQMYQTYSSLALSISPALFQTMSHTISRTLIRVGIQMQDDTVIKQGREIIENAKRQVSLNTKLVSLYALTFVKKECLFLPYSLFSKSMHTGDKLFYRVKKKRREEEIRKSE
ncbi:glycosyltransferase family 2 protein [Lacticigenium naphthae]|uniref:glycosyltransferase family 2 protein n=1 Tax=Lacticigenium naphthae TaxID=515351 RepID=UPI00040F35FB|nr:glycosyltransferase family 2 protein [Lacticigenium naphthae]